jgi:hypothetical protein
MLLYLTITATANFTPTWRVAVMFALTAFFYAASEIFGTCTFLFGALLANLQLVLDDRFPESQTACSRRNFCVRWAKQSWPVALFVVALLSDGLPVSGPPKPIWTGNFHRIGMAIFPEHGRSHLTTISYAWAGTSASFIALSVMFSPRLQLFFSHRYLVFLGSVSYPMYLLHGALIKTILVRLLKGQAIRKTVSSVNEVGAEILVVKIDLLAVIWASFKSLLWMGILIYASMLWRNQIDVRIVRVTKIMEGRMTGMAIIVPAETATVQCVPLLKNTGDIEKGVESAM